MRRALALAVLVFTACQPAAEPPHLAYEKDALSTSNPFPDLRLLHDGAFTVRDDWYVPFLPPRAATRQMKELLAGYAKALVNVEGVGNFGPTLMPASERLDRASMPGTVARLVRTEADWQLLDDNVYV